jgi:molybdopterin-guanine dinucleotide biosynthesis protein B
MASVDLLLVEGFKQQGHDKLEIFQANLKQDLLCLKNKTIVAVASDDELSNVKQPVFKRNDVSGIADFIIAHCGLTSKPDLGEQRDLGERRD